VSITRPAHMVFTVLAGHFARHFDISARLIVVI
jgi:hypothetical protein